MPQSHPSSAVLQGLRARLAMLHPRARHGVLAFGDARVDDCLAEGGLALGALHEVAADGIEAEIGGIGAGFIACLLAQMASDKPVVWIAQLCDLYPPGLLVYGLDPARLLLVQTRDDDETLAAMQAVLRGGSAVAVVAEAGRLGRTASRRLQLACLGQGSTGFVLRRWPHGRKSIVQEPTAAVTRWRLAASPSRGEHGEPGLPRWRVELEHARGGIEGGWIMEVDGDATHPLRVVAELADATPAAARRLG